jgi:hypothetical protein
MQGLQFFFKSLNVCQNCIKINCIGEEIKKLLEKTIHDIFTGITVYNRTLALDYPPLDECLGMGFLYD